AERTSSAAPPPERPEPSPKSIMLRCLLQRPVRRLGCTLQGRIPLAAVAPPLLQERQFRRGQPRPAHLRRTGPAPTERGGRVADVGVQDVAVYILAPAEGDVGHPEQRPPRKPARRLWLGP